MYFITLDSTRMNRGRYLTKLIGKILHLIYFLYISKNLFSIICISVVIELTFIKKVTIVMSFY
jgi:hypothetical protein